MLSSMPFIFSWQLFEVEVDNSEILLRYSSALVEGATNVFWYEFENLHVLLVIDCLAKLVMNGFYAVLKKISFFNVC